MPEDNSKTKLEQLSWKLQLGGFALAVGLGALLLGASHKLLLLAKDLEPASAHAQSAQSPPFSTVLSWVIVAGFLGGAARSLFMFIWEVGGHADQKQAAHYLSKWFLYLVKPVMGVAGGFFFFLAINLGVIGLFSDHGPSLDFPRVCLTAVLGGIFFESVFAKLAGLIGSGSGDSDPTRRA